MLIKNVKHVLILNVPLDLNSTQINKKKIKKAHIKNKFL